MPLTSVSKDPAKLTLTVVGDYAVSQKRLWEAFADPRQLERFWGPPTMPATFKRYDMKVGGRAEYFLVGTKGDLWSGSWRFTAVDPINSFEARDGDENLTDENMPMGMKFLFETTPSGARMTCITHFSSPQAMEETVPAMEEGLRATMPQLDAVLAK